MEAKVTARDVPIFYGYSTATVIQGEPGQPDQHSVSPRSVMKVTKVQDEWVCLPTGRFQFY